MVQRAIERRGIPTVSPTVAMDVTRHAKPPRAMFLRFMMGHHFGVPFHNQLQSRIIKELLSLIVTTTTSGEICQSFDVTWAQARREGKQIETKLSGS